MLETDTVQTQYCTITSNIIEGRMEWIVLKMLSWAMNLYFYNHVLLVSLILWFQKNILGLQYDLNFRHTESDAIAYTYKMDVFVNNYYILVTM